MLLSAKQVREVAVDYNKGMSEMLSAISMRIGESARAGLFNTNFDIEGAYEHQIVKELELKGYTVLPPNGSKSYIIYW